MDEFDPVDLEIMWSRVVNVAEEMWTTVLRTAVSTIIASANDFGCEILDAEGRSIAHAYRSMPVFNLTMPNVTKKILEMYPAESFKPGDVFITNDPWLCAGHLPDTAIVSPIFHQGRFVGFAGSIANVSDIGGTLDQKRVRESYEEGLFIPICKLYDGYEPNELVFDLFRWNVRAAEMVLIDIEAQVAANEVGMRRIVDFLDEYRLEDLAGLSAAIRGRSEAAMRRAIAGAAGRDVRQRGGDGRPHDAAQDRGGDHGERRRDDVRLRRLLAAGGAGRAELHADLHDRPHDVPDGVPADAGRAGERGLLRADHGQGAGGLGRELRVPGLGRRAGQHRLVPARRHLRGARRGGAGGHPGGQRVDVFDTGVRLRGGRGACSTRTCSSGAARGARSTGDGMGQNMFPSSASNVPVEVFEVRSPALVRSKEFVTDSGGAGKYRGAPGQRLEVGKLPGHAPPLDVFFYPKRLRFAAEGVFGGGDGNRTVVEDNGRDVSFEPEAMARGFSTVHRTGGHAGAHVARRRGLRRPARARLGRPSAEMCATGWCRRRPPRELYGAE